MKKDKGYGCELCPYHLNNMTVVIDTHITAMEVLGRSITELFLISKKVSVALLINMMCFLYHRKAFLLPRCVVIGQFPAEMPVLGPLRARRTFLIPILIFQIVIPRL